jgi:hypothetical protein
MRQLGKPFIAFGPIILAAGLLLFFPAKTHCAETKTQSIFSSTDGHQQLEIELGTLGQVEFRLKTLGKCVGEISGTATEAESSADPEIETTLEGNAYPVESYFFKHSDTCILNIRLDIDEGNYAWVKQSGCIKLCSIDNTEMFLR